MQGGSEQRNPCCVSTPPSGRSGWGRTLFVTMLWMCGFLLAQGLVLIALVSVLYLASFGWSWPQEPDVTAWILEADLDRSFLLVGTPVLGAIFLLLPMIRFVEGKQFRERIGWRTPTADEVVISLATVCPIALFGNWVYDQANVWWQASGDVPWLSATALHQTSLDHLYSTFQGVPYPILIVAMALAPAFAEELIFRGVLGRRLVRQFGIPAGILLSSAAFAVIHGSVPHAIATLPVGILLHLLYLQTGTIWVPVLVHFANNMLAITLVHFQLQSTVPASPLVIGSLGIYFVMMLTLLSIRSPIRPFRPVTSA